MVVWPPKFSVNRYSCVWRANHSQPGHWWLSLLVQRLGHSCSLCHEPASQPWHFNSTVPDFPAGMVSTTPSDSQSMWLIASNYVLISYSMVSMTLPDCRHANYDCLSGSRVSIFLNFIFHLNILGFLGESQSCLLLTVEISMWHPALRPASPLLRKLSVKTTSLLSQREPMGLRRGCLWCGTELW